MKMKDGLLLFHGSYTEVSNIDLNICEFGIPVNKEEVPTEKVGG